MICDRRLRCGATMLLLLLLVLIPPKVALEHQVLPQGGAAPKSSPPNGIAKQVPPPKVRPLRQLQQLSSASSATDGQQQMGLKRAAARELGLCHCPFDCLKEEGIRFHNVRLTGNRDVMGTYTW